MVDPVHLTLIAITDDLRDGHAGLVERARAAVRGGASMVQLRLKHADARTLVEVARALIGALPVPVVVNDRVDVALAAGAAGVHLGADDLPVAAVRRIAPKGFVIGTSVGVDEEIPNGRDADYVGIGPIFRTGSKDDAGEPIGISGFTRLARLVGTPAVAIGGVTAADAAALRQAGAHGVAVIRAVLGAPDAEAAARSFVEAMGVTQ